MPLKGGFLLCEWESPWQLTTVGQHVEGKKWQNVTSVFPCSFSLKTKGLLKSASLNGCACASVCLSKLFLLTSNQSASYHYGNHVCHSTKIKKKKKKKESFVFSSSLQCSGDYSFREQFRCGNIGSPLSHTAVQLLKHWFRGPLFADRMNISCGKTSKQWLSIRKMTERSRWTKRVGLWRLQAQQFILIFTGRYEHVQR